MLAPDVANMYPHKIPFRRQSFGSSGTAFAAPWSRFPPFGTPHGPPRSPVSSLRSGSLKVPASAALRNFRIVPSAKPSGIRPPLTQPRHQPSGPWSEKFVTKCLTPRFPPRRREVTACGGTFPDTVTYLHGLNTPIGPVSFRETRSPQAPHLPENGTFIQNRRICGFQAVARSPLPAPAAATSWLS